MEAVILHIYESASKIDNDYFEIIESADEALERFIASVNRFRCYEHADIKFTVLTADVIAIPEGAEPWDYTHGMGYVIDGFFASFNDVEYPDYNRVIMQLRYES